MRRPGQYDFNRDYPILISGGPQQYVVDVPAQGWDQRFESFQMYITEPGDSVIVWNVEVEVLITLTRMGTVSAMLTMHSPTIPRHPSITTMMVYPMIGMSQLLTSKSATLF